MPESALVSGGGCAIIKPDRRAKGPPRRRSGMELGNEDTVTASETWEDGPDRGSHGDSLRRSQRAAHGPDVRRDRIDR